MFRKKFVLSLSYGKDSLASLGAIEQLGLPLDRIVHTEVWATDTIPADLPPMVEFKKKADQIIKERYGIEVEHYSATCIDGEIAYKATYEMGFYHILSRGKHKGSIKGFPMQKGQWCQKLKLDPFKKIGPCVQYLGIAADEPNRFCNLTKKKRSPLVEAGWTEEMCRKWCEENDLLSPIYTTATRGGCWFCHNQSVGQLRLLRKNYPEYWQLLLKWDKDSPVTFKPDGHTVHDYDKRFRLEDEMCIDPEAPFRWDMLNRPLQMRLF